MKGKNLHILDQLKLPHQETYIKAKNGKDVYDAIKNMNLRGAPLIGVTAAYGVALEALQNSDRKQIKETIELLRTARPTAVNLNWALDRMLKVVNKTKKNIGQRLLTEAKRIEEEDKESCAKMGKYGARFVKEGAQILVHCNAGALATTGIGTALAVLYTAKQEGKSFKVFCTETRPYLQGARLTSWELMKNGIKPTLICESTVASLMPDLDLVVVGGDRIAKNGDTANKIGTKTIAIVAKEYHVPFIVVGPISSVDPGLKNGDKVPIEYRDDEEITCFKGARIATKDIDVLNPSFDVTPAKYITSIITEKGIASPPYYESIPKML